jgi:hypothetical protein
MLRFSFPVFGRWPVTMWGLAARGRAAHLQARDELQLRHVVVEVDREAPLRRERELLRDVREVAFRHRPVPLGGRGGP